jgi:hypothetical protein
LGADRLYKMTAMNIIFNNLLPMKILDEEDVQPDRLSDHIVRMFDQKRADQL